MDSAKRKLDNEVKSLRDSVTKDQREIITAFLHHYQGASPLLSRIAAAVRRGEELTDRQIAFLWRYADDGSDKRVSKQDSLAQIWEEELANQPTSLDDPENI